MRHRKKIRKLGRNKSQRRSLTVNLVKQLFAREKVRTTVARGREVKRFAEKLITLAKKGGVSAEQRITAMLGSDSVLERIKLAAEKYRDRKGGYTRMVKLCPRRGDAATMVLVHFV